MSEHLNNKKMPSTVTLRVLGVALFSLLLVMATTLFFLSRDLPEDPGTLTELPAAGLKFAFGSGHPEKDVVVVDGFQNGFALLSSGPTSVQADQLKVVQYSWLPQGPPGEFSFFWRQKNNSAAVIQAEILATGDALLDLTKRADWRGEIIEYGFLVAGDTENPVKIGQVQILPDNFSNRIKLLWQGWTSYELRSQQSINFLQGGAHDQFVTLPVLVIVWWLLSVLLLRYLPVKSTNKNDGRLFFTVAVALFIAGWAVLDLRWTRNSYLQASELMGSFMHTSEEQRSRSDLDGEIYKYVELLKKNVFKAKADGRPNRILIMGDGNAVDYFLVRAKYHLLPDSAHVAARLDDHLRPENLDFVMFFGQPGAIVNMAGWNAEWQNSLQEVNRGQWGVVYKIRD